MKINNFYFYFFLQFFTNLPRGSEGVSKIRPLLMGTIVDGYEPFISFMEIICWYLYWVIYLELGMFRIRLYI